jgi:NAD(P)-dependent dehydrogenase (short-subunit alcohol dehydrogenase family)
MTLDSFSLAGRVAVVTGGYGVIGGCIASALAESGARIVILGRRRAAAEAKAEEIRRKGGDALVATGDVLDEGQMRAARDEILASCGHVDILFNGAGGNVARARNDAKPIFEIPFDAFDEVLRLNLHGTLIPSLVFGESMAARGSGSGSGSIVNVSSMAATQHLSGVLGYSVAKAGIDNLTKWLAVEMARKHSGGVRVNAIAPGFFVSEQNRHVLVKPDGSPTDRARTIMAKTPMGRFGNPDELVGAVRWLSSDAASFVTGAIIPIDGGFSAFSGV